jgi:hypothetical protein
MPEKDVGLDCSPREKSPSWLISIGDKRCKISPKVGSEALLQMNGLRRLATSPKIEKARNTFIGNDHQHIDTAVK